MSVCKRGSSSFRLWSVTSSLFPELGLVDVEDPVRASTDVVMVVVEVVGEEKGMISMGSEQ